MASAIAHHQGLIGDIVTVSVARAVDPRDHDECRDPAHAWDIANELEGVRVLWHHDRTFMRHEGGKLSVEPVSPVTTLQQMRDVYTPGVARVCAAIAENPALARYTMVGRTVAVCTNGTRVLGLGNIGAGRVDAGDGGARSVGR